jgi:hypothetical protein
LLDRVSTKTGLPAKSAPACLPAAQLIPWLLLLGVPGCLAVPSDHVLMGIPFFGYDFSKPDQEDNSSSKKRKASSGSRTFSAIPIMGEAFLSVLRKIKPKLKWEEKHAEHRIKYKVGTGVLSIHTLTLSACLVQCSSDTVLISHASLAVVAGLMPTAWSASC